MQSHKDLLVWQKSISFAEDIYKLVRNFPVYEQFALSSQLRRASTSISMNIAEGFGRGTKNEILHFLSIASGSASEVDTQIILAYRFGYITEEEAENIEVRIEEIRRMLSALKKSIANKS